MMILMNLEKKLKVKLNILTIYINKIKNICMPVSNIIKVFVMNLIFFAIYSWLGK